MKYNDLYTTLIIEEENPFQNNNSDIDVNDEKSSVKRKNSKEVADEREERKNPYSDRDLDDEAEELEKEIEDENQYEVEDVYNDKVDIERTEKEYKKVRDDLISTFNSENEDVSKIRLASYEPFPTYIKSIKVVMEVDKEEPYLDKEKYNDGTTSIDLNDIFYNDVLSVAKKLGVKDIEWKSDDDTKFGVIVLED